MFSAHVYAVNTINLSDLMRRKLNSVNCRPKRRELIDEIPIIHEGAGLARKLLWKEKVEKIVQCELLANSEFKKRVCISNKYFHKNIYTLFILFAG